MVDHTSHKIRATRTERLVYILAAAMALLVAGLVFTYVQGRQTSHDLEQQKAKAYAGVGAARTANASLSAAGLPTVQIPTSAAPPTATVTATPSPGPSGQNGSNGKGIVSSALIGGHLVLGYSDGSAVDVGLVVGPAGASGSEVTGPPGPSGSSVTGPPGEPGRGIASASITTGGHLVVTYTDGTTADLGQVVGADGTGAPGPPGPSGLSGEGVGGFTFTVPGLFGSSTTYSCSPDSSSSTAQYSCDTPSPSPS